MIIEDLLVLTLIVLFGVLAIHQDIEKRKVSNSLTFSLVVVSFVYFVLGLWDLVWFDYILLFLMIFLAFYFYKRGTWGAADGKIFLALLLVLMAYGGSETFLRFILNLMVFYLLTILFLIGFCTTKEEKKKAFKDVDLVENGLIMIMIFILMRLILTFFSLDSSSVFFIIIFFIAIFTMVDLLKRKLQPLIEKMNHDVKIMTLLLLFAIMMIYGGGFAFAIVFLIISGFKIMLQVMGELTDDLQHDKRKKYESPFSIYLFFAAVYTLIAKYSVLEAILRLIV